MLQEHEREFPHPNFGAQSRLSGKNQMCAYIEEEFTLVNFIWECGLRFGVCIHSKLKLLGIREWNLRGISLIFT